MAIRMNCPRCKQALAVPNAKAESYANCPACGGRLWVGGDAARDAADVENVVAVTSGNAPSATAATAGAAAPPSRRGGPVQTASSGPPVASPPPVSSSSVSLGSPPVATPPPAPPVAGRAKPSQSPASTAAGAAPTVSSSAPAGSSGSGAWSESPPTVTSPPSVPQVAKRQRKMAKFISAESAESSLSLAADGKLPALALQEGDEKKKVDEKGRAMNPVVLFGLLSLSIVMSILLVLMDNEGPSAEHLKAADAARFAIQENYFGGLDRNAPLEPYQRLLREAERAHARGDVRSERRLYRQVLDILRAERPGGTRGITGSPARDRELIGHLLVLLRD